MTPQSLLPVTPLPRLSADWCGHGILVRRSAGMLRPSGSKDHQARERIETLLILPEFLAIISVPKTIRRESASKRGRKRDKPSAERSKDHQARERIETAVPEGAAGSPDARS